MKKLLLLAVIAGAIAAVVVSATYKPAAMLRHVVLFKFKDSASADDIRKVETAFLSLPASIKEIKDIEWGINNSPEHLNQGLTHCFFLSFASEKDRDAYLPHPAHKAFGEILRPYLDKVVVLDYWASHK